MLTGLRKLGKRLFYMIPENPSLLFLCKRYVDRCNGESNSDMEENGEIRFMREVLPRARVVVDAGANVGDWTALALKFNSKLEIHCFEPCRATFKTLASHAFPDTVTLNQKGLGSAQESKILYVFADESGINSMFQREGFPGEESNSVQRQETIDLVTLAEYCREKQINHIDFLKVDVEGNELEVFKGAESLFAQGAIEMIQFEYGGANIDARVFLKDIFHFFKRFPYSFFKILPHRIQKHEKYSQSLDNFAYQNWVIIRNGSSFAV